MSVKDLEAVLAHTNESIARLKAMNEETRKTILKTQQMLDRINSLQKKG